MLWTVIFLLVLVVWLYVNVAASWALARAASVSRQRKLAQALLVWLIPFLGAWLVLHLLADAEPEAIPERILGSMGVGWFIVAGTYSAHLNASEQTFCSGQSEASTSEAGVGSEP